MSRSSTERFGAWLYRAFGETGTARLFGIVEVITAALLLASPRFPSVALLDGALGMATFAVTCSTMLAIPIWEAGSGGCPFLDALGSFCSRMLPAWACASLCLGSA
ncbi:MAG: YkgB family protein [Methylobacterium sp.]|nr:YkgB family protein [Methylobacterium sp.]